MNRQFRTATYTILFAVSALATAGCNPASLSYFLFKGDGKAPAEFPLAPAEGRKEVAIAVMISAPNAPMEFAGMESELAYLVGRALVEQTKESRHPYKVLDQRRIEKFKQDTPGWKSLSPVEMARMMKVDYLLDARISNLGLYEPQMGKHMYQGRGTVDAEVYDAATGKETKRYFINAKMDAKPRDESIPVSQYRAELLQRIADQISWKHVPHVTDRRVSPVE
jgi:hypothetical protein